MKLEINADKKYTETQIIINCNTESRDVDKLLDAIRAVVNEDSVFIKEASKLRGEKEGKQYLLEAKDIIFTDTNEGRSFLYTMDSCYESSMKLYELEKYFDAINFMRANKSCLYNFDKIKAIENDPNRRIILTMINDMKVVVSRKYAKEFKRRLKLYHE